MLGIGQQRRLDIAFFLGVPAALTVTMALAAPYINKLGLTGGVIYLCLLSFGPWWTAGLLTQVAHTRLQRYGWPLWAVGSLGAVATSIVVLGPIHEINAWFRADWPGGQALAPLHWPATRERLGEVAINVGRATALWIAFLYAFSITLGWSRYCPRAIAPIHSNPARFRNSGASWSEAADIELARYLDEGLTPREISDRMQRTVAAVRARIAKHKHRCDD